MKIGQVPDASIVSLREMVKASYTKHLYEDAAFYADKLVCWTGGVLLRAVLATFTADARYATSFGSRRRHQAARRVLLRDWSVSPRLQRAEGTQDPQRRSALSVPGGAMPGESTGPESPLEPQLPTFPPTLR